MHFYRQIFVVALLMQLFVSSWARARFIPDPWPASSSFWNEIEDIDNNSDNNDNYLLERGTPIKIKAKKAFRSGQHNGDEERRKKYLGEYTNFQGGHALQGLWLVPGRR